MAAGNSEKQGGRGRLPRIRGWFIVLAGLSFGAGYLYYLHLEDEKIFVNTYYFRTLQEVATEFNNNLKQLVTLHKYDQSTATILSIFTSYQKEDTDQGSEGEPATQEGAGAGSGDELDQEITVHRDRESNSTTWSILSSYREEKPAELRTGQSDPDMRDGNKNQPEIPTANAEEGTGQQSDGDEEPNKDGETGENGETPSSECGDGIAAYTLEANRVRIIKGACIYFVDIRDLLPAPRNDFVLYVIADDSNRVLSSSGGAAGLSMIDTKVVSRAIQLRENQDWLKLATKQGIDAPDVGKSLPGYTTQIDVELNTGKSRLFVLPFHLYHEIGIETKDGGRIRGVPLYLVGIQPENVINSQESQRWNVSLLLLSLVALIFLWTVTRLLMLSRHQPLGNGFYGITVVASYATFLLTVALLLAFAHRNSEIAIKQGKAQRLMDATFAGLSRDLHSIFTELENFHRFYNELLPFTTDAADEPWAQNHESAKDSRTDDTACAAKGPGDGKSTILFECGAGQYSTEGFTGYIGNQIESYSFLQLHSDIAGFQRAAGRAIPPEEKESELPRYSKINIYGAGAELDTAELARGNVSESFDITSVDSLPAKGKLLHVFLMNSSGQQVLPKFYFKETNQKLEMYGLAHRDYFRRVRDRAGWDIGLVRCGPGDLNDAPIHACLRGYCNASEECSEQEPSIREENFYIQRLLNLNTGTRGSTIGMPLKRGEGDDNSTASGAHVLGADIVLPSLSLNEWSKRDEVQDLVVMVIDRVSGQVLYHMDHTRSMVENLYQAGRSAAGISHSISAGRFKPVPGYYHGESGDFAAAPLPIAQWAVVVFIPDAGTDSLMTNTFLVSVVGMGAALLLLVGLLGLLGRRRDTDELRLLWGVPAAVNGHGFMMFGSILIAGTYLGFWLGEIISQQMGHPSHRYTWPLSLLAVSVVLLWGYFVLQRLRRQDRMWAQLQNKADRGNAFLVTVFSLVGLVIAGYLHYIGNKPDEGLTWYYGNLHKARLIQEREELREVALTRFPNSIRLHGADPLSLLPISEDWRKLLSATNPDEIADTGPENANDWPSRERAYRRELQREHVLPEHVGTFGQYTSSTHAYEWIERYVLGTAPGAGGASDDESKTSPPNRSAWVLSRFVAVITATFLLLCVMWHLFYRLVIAARMVGPPGLTEHLRYIVKSNVPERAYAPEQGLVLDLHCQRHAGEDLSALLLRCSLDAEAAGGDAPESSQRNQRDVACRGVAMLLRECPWLKRETDDPDLFPGANISFMLPGGEAPLRREFSAGDRSCRVQLSDLDACLSDSEVRKSLLRLIRHLKAMCLAGELAELRINLGFHSYEALLLKAHNIESERERMTQTEFADWAETLMDFSVELPTKLTDELDPDFVDFECRGSTLLQNLPEELLGSQHVSRASWRQRRRWLRLRDVDKTGHEWASVNCILLKAGALFRHKWETCSSAEKLALYFLAKRKRINTANAQLLEQLALQGLIRVDHGRIRIVNNSLAYFARHAEDTSSLKRLVEIGGVGAWQEFRLPVTLVVLLLLGGIAFTSGNSLYMIAASLLGLLGTIGSLTSSAHMIRENLR